MSCVRISPRKRLVLQRGTNEAISDAQPTCVFRGGCGLFTAKHGDIWRLVLAQACRRREHRLQRYVRDHFKRRIDDVLHLGSERGGSWGGGPGVYDTRIAR